MRKQYPSDISREQFEEIKPILEDARKKTKPRVLDIYDIFCAALYIENRMPMESFAQRLIEISYLFFYLERRTSKQRRYSFTRDFKKNSWKSLRKTRTKIEDRFFNSRCTKREKYRHR